VEVYFPRYGWVEFEPTASEQPILRPVRSDQTGAERETRDADSRLERDLDRFEEVEEIGEGVIPPLAAEKRSPALFLLVSAGVLLAAGAITFWISRWRRLQRLSKVEKAYRLMCRDARLLGVRGEFYQTPYEYGLALARQVPAGARQIQGITALYVRERFAPQATGLKQEQQADEAWQELQPRLRRALLRRVPRFLRGAVRWRPR